jgi:putative ABC transport system permease protein
MFRNYLASAIRILRKRKSHAAISVFSLVVGMTCFILLVLFARYELSYDAFHRNADRIYRVGQVVPDWSMGGTNRFSSTSGALALGLKTEFPEVELSARVMSTDAPLVYNRNGFKAQGLFADRDFLNMFSYPLAGGDARTALQDPFTVVLSETLAGSVFGREDPIGKVLVHQNGREYRVTGVMKDAPRNTHLGFDYLLSFATMYSIRNDIETTWSILNYGTYVQLKEGVSAGAFEPKLKTLVDKYHPERAKKRSYFLIPLRGMHFATDVFMSDSKSVDKKNIYLLLGIAALILIIACANYINLATARASARSKEVGVRKTFGADRKQLVRQFLGESVLLALASLALSLVLVWLLRPAFNHLTGVDFPAGVLTQGTTLLGVLGLGLLVGFLAGVYPALVMSSLQPATSLKPGTGPAPGRRMAFRNGLVVFQFFATIVLIVTALVIHKQLNFIKQSDIGYRRDNVLALRLWDRDSRSRYEVIRQDLLKNPDILAVAGANVAPVRMTEANNFRVETESGEMTEIAQVTNYFVDFGYFDLFGMAVVDGRAFSPEILGDVKNEVLINETAARMAGLKNPVGKAVDGPNGRMRIIGVVKDIHFTSFKSKIGPLMFRYRPAGINMLFVRISNRDVSATIAAVGEAIRAHSPDFVYDYQFMEDLYGVLHQTESRLAGMLTGSSIVAILIAAVGLFGLVSCLIEKKKKEIGIRKVLGASLVSVSGLIVRDLFGLIGLACLASFPVAYSFAHKWLQGFFYRTSLGAGVFVLAAAIVLLIALACVARMTLRAAKENPAVSLKTL